MRKETREVMIACDGKVFASEDDCLRYESMLNEMAISKKYRIKRSDFNRPDEFTSVEEDNDAPVVYLRLYEKMIETMDNILMSKDDDKIDALRILSKYIWEGIDENR